MPKYSEKKRAALDALMRDDVHRHALEIIQTDGLPGLTVDRIARAIGVSRGTLYNYFADRDAIVDFVEERTFSPLVDEIEAIAKGESDPSAKLEAIAFAVFAGVRENFAPVMAAPAAVCFAAAATGAAGVVSSLRRFWCSDRPAVNGTGGMHPGRG